MDERDRWTGSRQIGLSIGLTFLWLCLITPGRAEAQPADTRDQLQAEQQEDGARSAAPPGSRVEEIVVSARKRNELLEETPLAVTALGAEALRESGISQLDEIRKLVPNVNWQQSPVGLDQASQFRIRGIGTTRISTGFEPGVGVYVDGVYLPRSISAIMSVIDVQQIEVLRGPQGTIFGKNSIGGAINVTTVKASDEFQGFAQLNFGNYGAIDSRAMVNLPLLDTLFLRASVTTNNFDGYTYNTFRNERTSDRESIAMIASLRWLPHRDLTVDVSGSWNRSNTHGMGGSCAWVRPGALAPKGDEEEAWKEACIRSGPFDYQSDVLQIADQESSGIWGVIDWDVGGLWVLDDLSLKSTTSWRQGGTRLRTDVDGTAYPLIMVAGIGGGPTDGFPTGGHTVSQEVQATATAWDGRINMLAGAFGFWEDTNVPVGTSIQVSPVPGIVQSSSNLVISDQRNRDWAFFGQASVDLLDWMSLTAGVRYTQERKNLDYSITQITADGPGDPNGTEVGETFDAWTPMASLALTLPQDLVAQAPIDHFMGYFTYSQGFRGGGFNSVLNSDLSSLTPFNPETLNSYEVGTKAIAFDQRLTVNLSLFLYDYKDIQVTTSELEDETIVNLTRNAAAGQGKGIELEARGMVLPGFVMNGSLGYIHTRYKDFANVPSDLTGELIDRSGESFNNTPSLQTNLGAQFTLPLRSGGPDWLLGYLTTRLDWYYQSAVHFGGPELTQATQIGYNLLHARISYSFHDDRAQVALWGKNLTNSTYFINGQPLASTFGIVQRIYGVPRLWGGELSYRF